MKRLQAESVGDVLRRALEADGNATRIDELTAASKWPAIVGAHIAARTMLPYVANGTINIRVPDAALRHELSMHRSAFVREFNRLTGKEVIRDIRFTN